MTACTTGDLVLDEDTTIELWFDKSRKPEVTCTTMKDERGYMRVRFDWNAGQRTGSYLLRTKRPK